MIQDSKNRGFGRRLIKEFEEIGFKDYKKINAGSLDDTIDFYKSLGYEPFLLVQFKNEEYNENDFSDFEIISKKDYSLELYVKNCNLQELIKLRKIYPKAKLQYIFTKKSKIILNSSS